MLKTIGGLAKRFFLAVPSCWCVETRKSYLYLLACSGSCYRLDIHCQGMLYLSVLMLEIPWDHNDGSLLDSAFIIRPK